MAEMGNINVEVSTTKKEVEPSELTEVEREVGNLKGQVINLRRHIEVIRNEYLEDKSNACSSDEPGEKREEGRNRIEELKFQIVDIQEIFKDICSDSDKIAEIVRKES